MPRHPGSWRRSRRWWDGDDGTIDQATDNAGKGSLHAGHDDDGVGLDEFRHAGENTVQASNADVGDESCFAAERARGEFRFARDGEITGPCGDDPDDAAGRLGHFAHPSDSTHRIDLYSRDLAIKQIGCAGLTRVARQIVSRSATFFMMATTCSGVLPSE